MTAVRVIGGGPAGCAAALAAIRSGATVELFERSRLPRHKVCGEFLSPEVLPILTRLGSSEPFLDAQPAWIRRLSLHFGRRTRITVLPEPGFGLSRYEFDHVLYQQALASGARIRQEYVARPAPGDVWAAGRTSQTPRGGRLFGFKAHYEGPTDDAVELFFFQGCYVGVSSIEGGRTNVCGLGPEEALHRHGFLLDDLLHGFQPLRARLEPLRRVMEWQHAGPLVFEHRLEAPQPWYLAGDALSFVDPFTGSGQLAALLTGSLAGESAARQLEPAEYWRRVRAMLRPAIEISSWIRKATGSKLAEMLLPVLPAALLFRLTRPRIR